MASLFHLFFNLAIAVIAILLAPQLAQLTQAISGDDVGRQGGSTKHPLIDIS